MLIQGQAAVPEHMHTCSIIWIQQVIVSNICVYTNAYMYAIVINKKIAMNLKESRRDIWGQSGQRKGENIVIKIQS